MKIGHESAKVTGTERALVTRLVKEVISEKSSTLSEAKKAFVQKAVDQHMAGLKPNVKALARTESVLNRIAKEVKAASDILRAHGAGIDTVNFYFDTDIKLRVVIHHSVAREAGEKFDREHGLVLNEQLCRVALAETRSALKLILRDVSRV